MKAVLRTFILGILAGILIAIGGSVNLQLSSMGHPILGGVFFSFGLMCVCILKANLFTGKVGYVLENDKKYALNVVIMAVGNIVGALAVGYLAALVYKGWSVDTSAKFLYGEGTVWYGTILRAIGAGVFVYLAVECFRTLENQIAKLVMVCLSIGTMVILGCNHSIANVFYFAYAQIAIEGFNGLTAVVSVIIAIVGNIVGSLIVYLLQNAFKKAVEKKEEPQQ